MESTVKHSVKEEEGVVLIELEGDVLGLPDARSLSDLVRTLIQENKNSVILDISRVELMNSSGLGILISALTSVRKAGGDLVMVNITDRIKNLLSITKLSSIIHVYDSVDEAKIYFKERD